MGLFILQSPSKKILFFIIFIISIFIKTVIEKKINIIFKDKRARYFELIIIYSLGDLLCGFLALIVIKRSKSNKIVRKSFKKKQNQTFNKINLAEKNALLFKANNEPQLKWIQLKRLLYLSIFDLLAQSTSFIYSLFYHKKNIKLEGYNKNIQLIFDIASRFILSKLLLKFEFYRHYYLSITINLISFAILSISDLYFIISENNFILWIFIGKNLLKTLLYSFANVVGKIGLNSEFLNPYNLLFYKGIIQSIFLIIISLILILLKQFYLFTGLFDNNEYNFNMITLIIILLNLFITIISNICIWKIIDLYNVQHLTIAKGGFAFIAYISALIQKQLDYQTKKKLHIFYYTDIFGYILLFLGTSIHNEIIILNFCNFSKYTYKKLKEREKSDMENNTKTKDIVPKSENSFDSEESIQSSENPNCINYINNNLEESMEI